MNVDFAQDKLIRISFGESGEKLRLEWRGPDCVGRDLCELSKSRINFVK